jgi:medium-chain acyl-[acyl-carrier-protein] hydrolase
MAKLRELNGTPEEVLENDELMQLLLPVLRADFALCETYVYRPEPPLDCPITAFGGLRDASVRREHLEAWREQTTSSFLLHMFPGDHFFLNTEMSLFLQTLSRILDQLVTLPVAGWY